jgi:hypothetical protein
MLDELRRAAEGAGRDPAAIEITSGGARTPEETEWFAELGVHRMTIAIRARERVEIEDELRRFGEDVIAATAGV